MLIPQEASLHLRLTKGNATEEERTVGPKKTLILDRKYGPQFGKAVGKKDL
jgi:hypothetical protein